MPSAVIYLFSCRCKQEVKLLIDWIWLCQLQQRYTLLFFCSKCLNHKSSCNTYALSLLKCGALKNYIFMSTSWIYTNHFCGSWWNTLLLNLFKTWLKMKNMLKKTIHIFYYMNMCSWYDITLSKQMKDQWLKIQCRIA